MKTTALEGIKGFNWSFTLITTSACLLSGIYRDGFSALFPFIQEEFQLSRAQLGLHSTFFFLTSFLASVFTGRLVDKKGYSFGILFGVFFIGFFTILHAFAPSYEMILILASCTGIGVSTLIPATTKGILHSFSPQDRGMAMGINMAGFPLGGILAATIIPSLANVLGWRVTLLLPGVLALLYSLIFFFSTKRKEGRDSVSLPQEKKEAEKTKQPFSFTRDLFVLFSNLYLLFFCILGFFLGFISGIVASHFTLFLYLEHGFSTTLAGLGFGIVQSGSVLGRPGWGLFCRSFLKGHRGKGIFYIIFFFALLSMVFGLFNLSVLPLFFVFLLAFFMGYSGRGWQGLYFTAIAEEAGENKEGLVVGLTMIFVHGGLLTGPPLFGYLADSYGSYTYSWLFLGLMMILVAIIQFLFMRRRVTQRSSPKG